MTVARLIHTDLNENQLPISWTFPEAGVFQGAQVLPVERALDIAINGDSLDDWHSKSSYSHIAFLEVAGTSGDKGPLPYRAVVESDIQSMAVISIADLYEVLLMIAIELDTDDAWDGDDVDTDYIIENHMDEIIRSAKKVIPEFINTI